MSINIVSLNVNGIRDHKKRSQIFQWLKLQNFDICLIQETHCETQDDMKLWSNEWQGQTLWSNGNTFSKGVAFLIKPKLDIQILSSITDNDGRYLLANLKIDDFNFSIVNIYAPNHVAERKLFYNDLNAKLQNLRQVNPEIDYIVGGDFNCTLNPQNDRRNDKGENVKSLDGGLNELNVLISNINLEDVWRRRHPHQKRYSFFKKNSKSASRIDFFLTPKSLDPNITASKITTAPLADHSAVCITLRISDCERGPGFWKMSTKVLNSEMFDNSFTAFWKSWQRTINDYNSKKKWWEITKVKIKEICIQVAKQSAKETNIKISQIEKALNNEKNKQIIDHEKINKLNNEFNNLWSKKTEGTRIRSRIQHYEQNEKSTQYFFSQEKIHARSKLWNQIKDSNGNIKMGIENILKEQVHFYSKLLSSEGWDKEAANKLVQNIENKITDEQKQLCEEFISETELNNGIKALKKNKSPGIDGIPGEFYKKYWTLIKKNFKQVIREIEETEELCLTQYRGVICLLFKQGDRDDLFNWRPITLLNTDYKLIAIIYAGRLKKILPTLIDEDQRAYIEGRQISETVRLTQDIIEFSEVNNNPGAIIFLDQQKAYDRVEWGYLELCLKKFGFGPKFIKWILMLYKCGQSCVQTNGFLSQFF